MTEKYWKERNHFNKINEKNIHPVLKRTFDDKKEKIPVMHFKALYYECLKGSLDLKLWSMSDELSVDDMALLACRDVGCELNYCTTSMTDQYEKPFENCDQQNKELFRCISREVDIYNSNPVLSLQDHLKQILEAKKKNKYKFLYEREQREKQMLHFNIFNYWNLGGKLMLLKSYQINKPHAMYY